MSIKKIISLPEFNFELLNIHESSYDDSGEYIVYELSYSNEIDPVFVYIEDLNILKFNDNVLTFDLRNKNNTTDFFNSFDKKIIELLDSINVVKRHNLKNLSYKSLINEMRSRSNELFDVVKLNISNDEQFRTVIYDRDKQIVNKDEYPYIFNNSCAKSILEIMAIIIKPKDKSIFLSSAIRQMKVQKLRPQRVTISEYSFADSEKPVEIPKFKSSSINESLKNIASEDYESESDTDSDSSANSDDRKYPNTRQSSESSSEDSKQFVSYKENIDDVLNHNESSEDSYSICSSESS